MSDEIIIDIYYKSLIEIKGAFRLQNNKTFVSLIF
jgi:hypothetical protein